MQVTITRHVLSPSLLAGATGRADARSQERRDILADLEGRLDEAGLHPGAAATDGPVPVLVVAPARRTTLSVGALPDLGALGLEPQAPDHGSQAAAAQVPPLGVTASIAVTLLRSAGWDGPVETLELASEPVVDEEHLVQVLAGRALVLVALAAPGPDLPAGAPPALADGQALTWQVADRLAGR